MASLKERMIQGMLWLAAARFLAQGISWVITVYVIRILTPDDYGLMGMTMVYTGFIIVFSEFGLGTALVQRPDLTKNDIATVAWLVFFLNLVLFGLSVVAAPAIADFYNESRVTGLIRATASILLANTIGIISSYLLTREMRFDRRSQAELSGTLAGGVTTLAMALNGFGVWSLVTGTIVLEVVKNVLYLVFRPWSLKMVIDTDRLKRFLDFGAKVSLSRLFWYVSYRVDIFIAGAILGKTQLGYYAIAAQFATIPLDKFVSLISYVAYPAFAEVQDDKRRLASIFLEVVHVTAFISFPAFVGVLLVADVAIPLLLTDTWTPAIFPLKVLCAVACLRGVQAIFAPLVLAVDRPDLSVLTNFLLGAGMSVAFYFGALQGLNGLAISWVAFAGLFVVIASFSIKVVDLRFRELAKVLVTPTLGSFFMVAVVIGFNQVGLGSLRPWFGLIWTMVIGAAAYIAFFALFDRRMFHEARAFLQEKRAVKPQAEVANLVD